MDETEEASALSNEQPNTDDEEISHSKQSLLPTSTASNQYVRSENQECIDIEIRPASDEPIHDNAEMMYQFNIPNIELNIIYSWLVCILCCIPCGVLAINAAYKAKEAVSKRNMFEAWKQTTRMEMYAISGIVLGIILIFAIIYAGFFFGHFDARKSI